MKKFAATLPQGGMVGQLLRPRLAVGFVYHAATLRRSAILKAFITLIPAQMQSTIDGERIGVLTRSNVRIAPEQQSSLGHQV